MRVEVGVDASAGKALSTEVAVRIRPEQFHLTDSLVKFGGQLLILGAQLNETYRERKEHGMTVTMRKNWTKQHTLSFWITSRESDLSSCPMRP